MAVREGLLALLDAGPRHGYQLKTEFESATGGIWPLNVGQVYTTLDRLERDGLVDVETTEDADTNSTKIYAMTASGREVLGAWWQAVPAADPPPRDELMLKILMAIESGGEHALAVITHHRTALITLLQQRRKAGRIAPEPHGASFKNPEQIAARLVDDALIVRAEADLRWLDLCESRIQTLGSGADVSTESKEPT
jgi:DNA-binding PadR family transcriptional regulator